MTRPKTSPSMSAAVRPAPIDGLTAYARRVLAVVDRIPAGKVLTYGDVAEFTGQGTPRTVGTVLAKHGHEVAWHRVVQASGQPAKPVWQRALVLLAAENCPLIGDRVDLVGARWDGSASASH